MTLQMIKATYRAIATSTLISFGKSSKGNVQIAVEFEILDRNEGTEEDVLSGDTITWQGTFSDNTTARTIESLLHAGWQGDDPSELDGKPGSAELPTIVELVCEPDEWDGKVNLKVQWVNKPGRGRFAFKEPMNETDLRAFGAQLRATVQSVRASGGAPRASRPPGGSRQTTAQPRTSSGGSQPHPNAPGNRDDIPF